MLKKCITLTSLNATASDAKVLFMTDGLFLTLGKIILPFLLNFPFEEDVEEDPSILFNDEVGVTLDVVVVILI